MTDLEGSGDLFFHTCGLGGRGGEGGQRLIDYPQFGLVFQLSFFKSLKSLFQKQSFECI